MSRFLNIRHAALKAYVPGEQPQNRQYIKLNTNESPFPPSPGVIAAVSKTEAKLLNLYSDPEGKRLHAALAGLHGVRPENIIIGNGSDEILAFTFMAFCGNDTGAAFPDITYGFYPVFAKVFNIPYTEIPLKDDFSLDISDYFDSGKTIYFANPNAPTGIALSIDDIRAILSNNLGNVVVVDEAYVDFGAESAVTLIGEYDNLLIIRTYSKYRSMAGARLGYAIGCADIITDLETMRNSFNPYNVNRLTLAAGEAAAEDDAYYRANSQLIAKTRARVSEELKNLGFSLTDSKANFLFTKHSRVPGDEIYRQLKARGILVRRWDSPRIADYLRITVGTDAQMDALITTLKEIIS